jgi:hypothetical protein
MAIEQGVPQREIRRFDLPALVIKPDHGGGREPAVVHQRGDQPVGVPDPAAVGAGHRHAGLDDPDRQPAQVRQVGAVRQVAQDCRVAGGLGPRQQQRAGGRDLAQERVRIEGPVQQHQHARPQQGQQPPGHSGLIPVRGRPERRAEQAAGAGLGQRHQPQRGIPGKAHPVPDPAQPPAVAVRVGGLDRVAAVEGDRAQPAEPHPAGVRLGQRPGDHLEQRLQRRRAEPAPQVPQRLLRRAGHRQAFQPGGQLGPDPGIAQPGIHPQHQHEVHPDPRRQVPQPALHRLRLLQDVIDQLERQVLR